MIQTCGSWNPGWHRLPSPSSETVPPKSVEQLDPGATLGLKDAAALLPRDGLLWVKLRAGTARFADSALPAPVEDIFFPLSPRAWLDADAGAEVFACRTREVGGPVALDRGLQTFHTAVLEGLVRGLQATNEREVVRASRRRSSDQAHLAHAMRLLASPLRGEAGAGDLVEVSEDPWFLACAAIGRHDDIEFKPGADKALRHADPVGAIARSSGVRARVVALKGPWWRQDGPALLGRHESDGMPVALLPDASRGYRLYDPSGTHGHGCHRAIGGRAQPLRLAVLPAVSRRSNSGHSTSSGSA